jgi:hypothetical protein
MKKIALFFLVLNVSAQLFGQDFTTSFGIKLSKKSLAYNFVDKEKDEAYLFVANTKVVKYSHFGSNFEVLDSMTVVRPEKEFVSIAGVNKSDESMSVFWINDDNNQLYQQEVNFKNRSVNLAKKHRFDFSNQKVIQAISSNTSFHLLTITTNSNLLTLYTFDANGSESIHKIDLGNQDFVNSKDEITNLYGILKEKINSFDTAFELPLIDNETPNSLTITAKKRKLFLHQNALYLSIDSNIQYTQIIILNLSDYSFSTTQIQQKIIQNDVSSKTNSLIVGDVIYQIAANSQKMIFSVCTLDGNMIKEYSSNSDGKFEFSNSAILESTVNPKYRKNKIEKTGQFISTMSTMNFGLSYYNYKGKNLITIGGVTEHIKKTQTSNEGTQDMFVYFGQFGLIGSLVYVVLFHQTNTNYDFGRDFTYFYSCFDQNFNNVEGEITYTSFDLIKNFFTINPSAVFPTIISLKNGNYLGYYKDENKKYTVLSYEK